MPVPAESIATNPVLNAKVHALLEQQAAAGWQRGVQVCAYLRGEPIVDTWLGVMGPKDPRPVGPDTLFSVFLTTKGIAALLVHILADRGLLDYDRPVAAYWPEFAANGKERVTVAQALSHQAGLHTVPTPNSIDLLENWDFMLDYIASLAPAWEPGTATGYHALTYAWVAGGIIEKASGRRFQELLATEIAEPLGIADSLFVGIPEAVADRCATLFSVPQDEVRKFDLPPDHDRWKAMPMTADYSYNDLRVRKACIPSANGHVTARALARMYGALANGGCIDGVRLVSEGRIASMQRLETEAVDRVILEPRPKGIGFMLGGPIDGVVGVMGPRRTAFGHSGMGGSTGFADPETGLAIAVVPNRMTASLQGEGPTFEICELIRAELGIA
jgi:CubicO group peptidase (beta-lactamase class C family)